ncbi:hypothetical protein EMCRGX_G024515 [Ephydatia muelleri]
MDVIERKEILRAGEGDIPLYQKNTKVCFHFRAFSLPPDGSTSDEIIDDTRNLGTGPFELLIGREFKLSVWEDVVKTMRVGEIVKFQCPYKAVVMEYVLVSKALRELAKKRAGNDDDHHNHQHRCGFHHAVGGTGHCDLDSVIQNGSPIVFEFELVSVRQPGEYLKDSWAMSTTEKSDAAAVLRGEGNALYELGKFEEAAKKYFLALSYLEELSIKEKAHSDEWNRIEEKKVPLLLNYAQCKLIMMEYAEAIRHTTTVLEFDSNNVKALFRRGKAHAGCWNVEQAKLDFAKACTLDPSLSKVIDKELTALMQRVNEKNTEERNMFKGKLF